MAVNMTPLAITISDWIAGGDGKVRGSDPTGSVGGAPLAPTGFTAVYLSDTSLSLAWTDNATNELNYELDRSPNGTDTWTALADPAANATSATSATLTVDTQYFYRLRAVNASGNSSYATASGTTTAPVELPIGTGTQYYISKTGNNTDGLSEVNAFASPQQFLDVASAGDTGNVGAGTYTGASGLSDGESPYLAEFSFAVWDDGANNPTSGTLAEPITLRALAGDEDLVIFDGEGTKGGIHCNRGDYYNIYNIKFFDTVIGSLKNWSQVPNAIPTQGKSQGWRIERCGFDTVNSRPFVGQNTSHIAMWGTEDWIVRNNTLDNASAFGATNASNIQAYGAINALIEHNEMSGAEFGVFWKDHFLESTEPRVRAVGSEIRYNKISATIYPLHVGIRPGIEAGSQYFHHNVLYGMTSGTATGIHHDMAGADDQSGQARFEHNTIYGNGGASTIGINVKASDDVQLLGNIIANCGSELVLSRFNTAGDAGREPFLTASDRNVFDTTAKVQVNAEGTGATTYSSLATWQAVLAVDHSTVSFDNPDPNTVGDIAANLFTDAGGGDFTNKAGSAALALMADSSNAGAYQLGTEVIGVQP